MAEKIVGLFNAANFPYVHTITSQDQTDGYAQLDFQTDREIVFQVSCRNASGTVIDLTGAVITQPEAGKIKIASGGGYTVTATDQLFITGQAYDSTAEYIEV